MRSLPYADPGAPDVRSAGRYLRRLADRSRATLLLAMVLGIIWMLSQAFVPAVIGKAIDAALAHDGMLLVEWAGVFFGLGVVQAAAGISRHRLTVVNFYSAIFTTIQTTVRHAARLGSSLSRRISAGEMVAIGTSDIRPIGASIDILARGSGAAVSVIAVMVILLTTSVPLGLVVVVGVPVLMAVVGLLIRPLHRLQRDYREQQGRLTGQAADLVGGLRVLRGVGGEAVMAGRYREESQRLRAAGVRVARVESLLEAAQMLLPGVFLVLVTWLGARFALTGRITVGQLVAFYGYAAFLVSPLHQLAEMLDKMTRGHVAARRVVAMLQLVTDLPTPESPVAAERLAGDLADPSSGVIVHPGETTAIVAADPADAHRIADRLGRYAEGATAGGVPLSDFATSAVRERILVAGNDDRLFSGPLRADLDPQGSNRLPAALHAAAATDILEALPDGLDTEVAERGRSLSGGQQQRLRLVRALVADPATLILVEPTSAVDAHTEARIAGRLREARSGRTTVICTSSPLVLDHTDRVVFVEHGRVVASGTHRGLLVTEPRYARTVLREDEP